LILLITIFKTIIAFVSLLSGRPTYFPLRHRVTKQVYKQSFILEQSTWLHPWLTAYMSLVPASITIYMALAATRRPTKITKSIRLLDKDTSIPCSYSLQRDGNKFAELLDGN